MESRRPAYDPHEVDDATLEDVMLAANDDEKGRWRDHRRHDGSARTGRPRPSWRRAVAKVRSVWWIVDTSLLLIIIGLLVLLRAQSTGSSSSISLASSTLRQIGGDVSGGGPQFKTEAVKWDADESFVPEDPSEFFSAKTLARWNTLMPEGTGWSKQNQTFFTTSMTHQLHCLFMMGRIYSGILTNASLPDDYHSHYLHCVNYLRQSIMCSADLAMEAHEPSDADDNGPADGGWSGHHVCKNYGDVKQYLAQQIADGVRVVLPIDD